MIPDPTDAFYQHLDSEQLLNEHGKSLAAEARGILTKDSSAKVAGLITTADSPDAVGVRQALAQMTGQVPPPGLMVGIVPRAMVEKMLLAAVGSEPWHEQGWQPQQVLPVVVSTRDGHRFGFFGSGRSAAARCRHVADVARAGPALPSCSVLAYVRDRGRVSRARVKEPRGRCTPTPPSGTSTMHPIALASRRISALLRSALALVMLAVAGSAQGWVDVTPTTPGPANGGGLCYDPTHGVSWIFSTGGAGGYPLQASSWNGVTWTTSPATGPISFAAPQSTTWDSIRQYVVVAHLSAIFPFVYQLTSWDGVSWGLLPQLPINLPCTLAFDPAHGCTVACVQASSANPNFLTYTFDGTSWTPRPSLVSPACSIGALFFDATRNRVVLLGDRNTIPEYWEWSGTNWIQSYPVGRQSYVGQVASAPQVGINLAQVFPTTPTQTQPQTFVISNGAFSQIFLNAWPAARSGHGLVFDQLRNRFVLHGGSGFADTWELQLGPSAAYSTFGVGCPGSGGTPALAPQQGSTPRVNTQFSVQISSLPWSGPAFMVIGFSDQAYGATPLPVNLGFLGAPLCNLRISMDVLYAMPNVLGLSVFSMGIPNMPGVTFFQQTVIFDPPANALGLTLSNAGRATIGQ